MRYAVINQNNEVINVIEWCGTTDYDVNKGHGKTGLTLIPSETANIGYTYINGEFIKPIIEEQEGEI